MKQMTREAWERARVQRFNELIREDKPSDTREENENPTRRTKDGSWTRVRIHEAIEREFPESLILPPPPLTKRAWRKTQGRPRKQCGHSESERKLRKDGHSTYCAGCKREWMREYYQKRKAS